MSTAETKRRCPVCGDGRSRRLYRQSFQQGPLGDGYDVVTCSNCGAAYAEGIPTQSALDRYYARRSKYSHLSAGASESPSDHRRFEATVAQVRPYLPSRRVSILDVGCATGGLVATFVRRGYPRTIGADPSPACARLGRRLHGVGIRTATIADLDGWSERFDLVLMLGVLEHLRDVRPALGIVTRLLRPGGLLYLAVPDAAGLADCADAPFQQFSVEHLNFFSAPSLEGLAARCGLARRRIWNWRIPWRDGVIEPIVSGLFSPAEKAVPLRKDRISEPALRRYVRQSSRADRKLLAAMAALEKSGEPLLVWGAGTLARRLLRQGPLARLNLSAFVDGNPHWQGRRLAGRRILPPEAVVGRRERILIVSQAFEREIVEVIRGRLGLRNGIISLAQGGAEL